MTPKIKPITSYQHLQLFINELDLSDTISSSMHRDEYSGSVMLWGLNKSTLQKEVKRSANKMFQILSATKNITIASPVISSGIAIDAASDILLWEITVCSISAVLIL